MEQSKKSVILFDFFGVISSEVAHFWFERYFDKEAAAKLKEDVFVPADLGIITEEESYKEMQKLSGVPAEEIREAFYSLVHINDELLSHIKELRKKYKVYVISNASASFLRNILDTYSLYKYFDGIFISAEMKLAKPDTRYFSFVLDSIGFPPSAAVMTDDNPTNVKAAGEAGIDGIVFKNTDDFITKLYKTLN